MKPDTKPETTPVSRERRKYSQPELVELGNVPDLTRGGSGSSPDGRRLKA